MNIASTESGTAAKIKNDPRLEHIAIYFSEDSADGQDIMRPIYECMYGILTNTAQKERKGA